MTTPTTDQYPLPAGAVSVDPWKVNTTEDGSPTVYRGFMGSSWQVTRDYDGATVEIQLGGFQYADGDPSR